MSTPMAACAPETEARSGLPDVSGMVFDIKTFAVHDGPGIRTTVFLKGCDLQCKWCHNPEGIAAHPQLVQFQANCIGCGACLRNCPRGAVSLSGEGVVIDRAVCDDCGECAVECYAEALVMSGRPQTAREVFAEVAKDRAFYDNSGGGMTLSGGEPLAQPQFARVLLTLAREAGIATCVDTSGHAEWPAVEALIPLTDLWLYDVKTVDPDAHERYTGASSDLSLGNLRRLSERGARMIVRVPVVPQYTAAPENIAAIADLARATPAVESVELLRYHPLGESKYASIGMDYALAGLQPPTHEEMQRLQAIVRSRGVGCKLEV